MYQSTNADGPLGAIPLDRAGSYLGFMPWAAFDCMCVATALAVGVFCSPSHKNHLLLSCKQNDQQDF